MTSAPIAPKHASLLTHHGDTRIDEWYWLRERENPEVIALLEAENAYCNERLESMDSVRAKLFEEMVARIQETDLSLPVRKGTWWYYTRTQAGLQYPIHCRKPDINGVLRDEAHEQVMLDQNKEAGDSDFFSLGTFDVSPCGNYLAYSCDHTGDEVFTLHIRDLRTGEDLPDVIENAFFGSAWSRDADYLFFVRADGPMRPYQVWRHHIGSPSTEDVLVFHEEDDRFFVGVGNTKTDDFIFISSESKTSTEERFLSADNPTGEFTLVQPRTENLEYGVSHHRDHEGNHTFYILTNEGAPNFRLMRTSLEHPGREFWEEVIPHDERVRLNGVDTFADFLVVAERRNANAQFAIFDLSSETYSPIAQPEEAFTVDVAANPEFDTSIIRFMYTSLVTQMSVFDYDVRTGERTLRKQQPVLGPFDAKAYETHRIWATADDGTEIPVSIVYRKDRQSGPLLLSGYGAYEISSDPYFSSLRLSLLDRGFAFAIAHIRGGGEMGRAWYENGRREHKRNSFTDFIACAEKLIADGYTTSSQLVIRGGSAGGLLMGAVTNMRPDLFGAVIAEVPFVDTLTTMCDPTMPLTTHEYDEWGDPSDDDVYETIKAYSPVDNVRAQEYPALLVTAGLNDPLVGYQEPAKWVQKLRDLKTNDNDVLLKTEMGAGHQGLSGRYDVWKDEAFIYAYIFYVLGIPLDFKGA